MISPDTALAVQKLADDGDEVGRGERLRQQHVVHAKAGGSVEGIWTSSGIDDRDMGMPRAHLGRDVRPVPKARHVDVGDQQGECLGRLLDQRDRMIGVVGLANVEPLLLKLLGQYEADQGLILDKQNAHVFGPARFPLAPFWENG